MNASQIHLALTHLPVVLSLTGLVTLVISLIVKQPATMKVSLYILIAAGLATLPVFFSGEGAEEIVEDLPGVSEALIEKHEGVAKLSLFAVLATAFVAMFGLVKFSFGQVQKVVPLVTLAFGLASTALMAQTAHLGGQIRHSEIRAGFVVASENSGNNKEVSHQEQEDDD